MLHPRIHNTTAPTSRAIKDHDIIHLSLRDQESVAQALLVPPNANLTLRKAMKRHDTLIRPA